mmetsp:Transcript_24903/g.28971  ORF Transcript_24903/g.28971 Transcript_24903/m.28971 type:complete len:125 (+) Transcript_24903:3-377(+)
MILANSEAVDSKDSGEKIKDQMLDGKFLPIVQAQSSLGYWEADKLVLEALKLNINELFEKLSKYLQSESRELNERIAITVAVLAWIERDYAAQKSSWVLIHRKGQQWLNVQKVNYTEAAAALAA